VNFAGALEQAVTFGEYISAIVKGRVAGGLVARVAYWHHHQHIEHT